MSDFIEDFYYGNLEPSECSELGKEIKEKLDQYVIGQDNAKKTLCHQVEFKSRSNGDAQAQTLGAACQLDGQNLATEQSGPTDRFIYGHGLEFAW